MELVVINDDNGVLEEASSVLSRLCAYDKFKLDDIALSRLAVEALLTVRLRDEIRTRYSHVSDFEDLLGNIYFMMILETCNILASMDVKGAEAGLNELKLSSFPGKNVSAFATTALKLIKVMNSAYSLPLRTSSELINKVTST